MAVERISQQKISGGSKLLRPLKNVSVVDKIVQRLTDALIMRELKPGEKIPTEMELSESMQVGRNSVREAIKVLTAMGVLEIRRSEGTFVCQGFSAHMLDPVVYGMILEGDDSNIIEMRRLFDIGILELLVAKADYHMVAQVGDALEELTRVAHTSPDAETLLKADIQFHKVVELLLNNPLVNQMSIVINRLTRPTRMLAVEHFLQNAQIEEFIQRHEEIYGVIKNLDAANIMGVIDLHFKHWSYAVQ